MKLENIYAIAAISLSLALVAIPSAGIAEEFAQCSDKCQKKYDGRWSKDQTPEGACESGCSAAHWTGKKKALEKCKKKYPYAKLYLACKDGASSY